MVSYNELLCKALHDEKIDFTTRFDEDSSHLLFIVGDRAVTYDRWGYCSDNDDALDQGDLSSAINYLLKVDAQTLTKFDSALEQVMLCLDANSKRHALVRQLLSSARDVFHGVDLTA